MSKFLTQWEHDQRIAKLAEDFRHRRWDRVFRYLLAEAGVELCDHGFPSSMKYSHCEMCRAEMEKGLEL